MVDVMGHELRTPITIVRNALLVLKSKLKEGEKLTPRQVLGYVEKSIESTRREITLVETLLSATKIESNRVQLLLTKTDMVDVINDSMEAHKQSAIEKKLKVIYQRPKKDYWAYADRTRTQEIMDNFFSNAVKYTPKGSITITIDQDKRFVSISVKDTGAGIHSSDLKHLGKKFYRAKQYLNNKNGTDNKVVRPGGTGLGLYVSFNLIRIMHGKITIKSKLGQGSTFTMSLPIYQNQQDKSIDQTFGES
jgi:two-component system sensor histidine kinase VicK